MKTLKELADAYAWALMNQMAGYGLAEHQKAQIKIDQAYMELQEGFNRQYQFGYTEGYGMGCGAGSDYSNRTTC